MHAAALLRETHLHCEERGGTNGRVHLLPAVITLYNSESESVWTTRPARWYPQRPNRSAACMANATARQG